MVKDILQHLYLYLQETDTFIGMRMFSYCAPQGISLYREILIITLKYVINFCTLINIFSTQL